MRRDYFKEAYEADQGIRLMTVAVRVSRVLDLGTLRHELNERLARLEDRKPINPEAVAQIAKNYLKAKIAKRIRSWRIKPYTPKVNKESPTNRFRETLIDQGQQFAYTLSSIYRERAMGRSPSILIPGFIPDGNEAFFLLRKSFLNYGPVFYFNYPNQHFNKETLFHQIYDLVRDQNSRTIKSVGQKTAPLLIGTSFGCRIIISFLAWLQDLNLAATVDIRGLVLLSPVLCLDDVLELGADKQKTLVGRAVAPLYDVDPNDSDAVEAAMKKARNIFTKMFQSGAKHLSYEEKENIPILAIEEDVLRIFDENFSPDSGFFSVTWAFRMKNRWKSVTSQTYPHLYFLRKGNRMYWHLTHLPSTPCLTWNNYKPFSPMHAWKSCTASMTSEKSRTPI